jgi:putative ABC transport system permease protein
VSIAVGGGNVPTGGQGTITGVAVEGRDVDQSRLPDVRYSPVSDDYFTALGIPLVRGRVFNVDDRDGAPWVAVVSQRLATQLWPGRDPIGARIKPDGDKPWATIVGVVGDVRMGGADAPQPTVYTSQRQDHWNGASSVILRAIGDPDALFASVRQAMKRVDSTMPIVGLRTIDDLRRSTPAIAERRVQMQLMSGFALAALAVSCIGVYGVGAYATQARHREFGIRMALGATRSRVLWLALRDGVTVLALGAVVGIPLAGLLGLRLRGMLYEVTPFDPLTLAVVIGALIVVVLAASFVPARRATRIDPARTMRTD